MTLDELAIKHGTDKCSLSHNYTRYYEMFFEPIRQHKINLLEIGIYEGNSLRLWKEYFPNAIISGIDIVDCSNCQDERIITHVVDQSSRTALEMFGSSHDQLFDIIIDDGSHESEHMILSFETLFPYLKQDGLYIIEDMICDYDSRWNKGVSIVDRFRKMVGEVQMNGNIPGHALCANKFDAIKKYDGSYFEKNIEWVFISCGIGIIKKIWTWG